VFVLRAEADGVVIEHRPLDYDYATAAAKIRGAHLPEEYAASLETGLWPSCDVLPLKEVHERGVALEPGSAFWSRPFNWKGHLSANARLFAPGFGHAATAIPCRSDTLAQHRDELEQLSAIICRTSRPWICS
jgi:hypothetical protein